MSKIHYTEQPKSIVTFETKQGKTEITLTEGEVSMRNHLMSYYSFNAEDIGAYIDALTMLQRRSR